MTLLLLALLLPTSAHARKKAPPPAPPPMLQLVETAPVEASLDSADIPEAADVWLEMIGSATKSLDFAEFYLSTSADTAREGGDDLANPLTTTAAPDRMEPILGAIEQAAARGVTVRLLADAKFAETYPAQLDRLDAVDGIEVRRWDVGALTGGVLHAKYFLVDAEVPGRAQVYLGSQNFDWRSLAHVQELGVRSGQPQVVGALHDVFTWDWAMAGGATMLAPTPSGRTWPATATLEDGTTVALTAVASPEGLLPEPDLWDLPRLVALIDSARDSVDVQLLTYSVSNRDKHYWPVLDDALRQAALRGVKVRLLLSHWQTRSTLIPAAQSLEVLPDVEVRILTVPDWSGGFIPYARVSHAKFMVVDRQVGWVGTSNWGEDYFDQSRNVGLVVDGAPFAAQLEQVFSKGWDGPHAAPVDPVKRYPAPRTK